MFILARRTSALAALCKVHNLVKLSMFFSRNFDESKHQSAASANGFAALSKGKHIYAAAFFVLAQDHRSAVQVLLQRCHAPTLALFVLRIVLHYRHQHQLDNGNTIY
uniref:DmX-like protein 2 n=1 Tax=Lygus hesperus TaxID=30085 RepID=A0A0A9YBF0_LYGHE